MQQVVICFTAGARVSSLHPSVSTVPGTPASHLFIVYLGHFRQEYSGRNVKLNYYLRMVVENESRFSFTPSNAKHFNFQI